MKMLLWLNLFFVVFSVHAMETVEEKVFLYGDKPYRDTPTKKIIVINAARNEFETFIIEFNELNHLELKSFDEVKLDLSPATNITLTPFVLGAHHLKHSSHMDGASGEVVDIVVPNDLAHQKKFKIHRENVPLKVTGLFEVFVPPSVTPGLYKGTLKIKLKNKNYNYPITIAVHGLTLPGRFDLKTSFGFSTWGVLKKHYGDWHEGEFALYEKYFDLATNHRIDLHKIYAKFPKITKVKGKIIDLLAHDENEKYAFFPLWDSLKKGMNSDHGFKWSLTNLPVPDNIVGKTNSEALAYFRELQVSVKANDLKDSTFVYYADEPKPHHLKSLKESLTKIKMVAPDLNYLMTLHYNKEFDRLINWWAPNYHEWNKKGFPTPQFYQERQKNFKEQVWTYVSCNAHGCDGHEHHDQPDFVIDRYSFNLRVLPWIAVQEHFDGILYYDTVYGYSVEHDSPWKDHFSFTGYGEGNLFYPCNKEFCGLEEHHALASLRLKTFRDGLEDAQILKMAKDKNIDLKPYLEKAIHYGSSSINLAKTKEEILTKLDEKK